MPLFAIAAALLAASCWGGNFSATKFILLDFPPLELLFLRFSIVSLLLAPFALRKRPWPPMRDIAFISFTLLTLQFGCMFSAIHWGLSISSAVIASQMGVPFACVLSAVLHKDFLGPWRSAGLMVALFGVMVVAGTPNAADHWVAFLIGIFGALAWAIANIRTKRLAHLSVTALQFWPALFSLPQFLLLTLLFEDHQIAHIEDSHWQAWAGLAYSVVISSLVGYGIWNWLVKHYPLSQIVPYTLFTPIVGITAGALIFGDAITAQMLLGTGLTIVGVAIISLRRPKLVEPEVV